MRHRVEQTRFTHYGRRHIFWECSCGRQGTTLEGYAPIGVVAGAHVPEGECVTLVDAPKEEA